MYGAPETPRTSTEARFFPPHGTWTTTSDLVVGEQQGLPAGPECRSGSDHLLCQHSVSEIEMVRGRDCERDEVIE